MSKIAEALGFHTVSKSILDESEGRRELVSRGLPFGVSFLDVAFRSILPVDLVLIGARSGAGKTELMTTIAKTNALRGTRVAFFALEAARTEIERRMKYQMLLRMYKSKVPNDKRDFNYRDWFYGDYEQLFAPYNELLKPDYEKLKNLSIFYRNGAFDIDAFEKNVMAIKDDFDIFLADHIHYFEMNSNDQNKELGQIVKRISRLIDVIGKPVVLAGHLRKTVSKAYAPIVPDYEEFMGSSDLPKIITKGIIMAPDSQIEVLSSSISPTLVRLVKSRLFGSVTKYVGRCYFDTDTNEYLEKFNIVRLEQDERSYKELDAHEIPQWMKPRLK